MAYGLEKNQMSSWDIRPSYEFKGMWELFNIRTSATFEIYKTREEALAGARKRDKADRR